MTLQNDIMNIVLQHVGHVLLLIKYTSNIIQCCAKVANFFISDKQEAGPNLLKHPSIRPVATDFQSFGIAPCFSSYRMAS